MPGSNNVLITLTWEDFLREFIEKYTPKVSRDRKRIEFLEFKQNELSVVDYEVQFVRLSKYTPEEVATDELKRNKFERGLNLEIHKKMAIKTLMYREVLEIALRAKEMIIERNELKAKKKKTTSVFTPSSLFRTGGGSSFRGFNFQ